MAVTLFVPKETLQGEKRVALVPAVLGKLKQMGLTIRIEKDAGAASLIPDSLYDEAEIVNDSSALSDSDIILKVQPPTEAEIEQMKEGAVVIGYMSAHLYPERVKLMRDKNISAFSVEFIPRISRAQSMDALSSQAAVAGYKAALIAADSLSRFFPMLTTAAGTIRPAKTVVIGAGVAGLQAIATCKRLGAIVEGYDVRSAAKEQVESLGAKFIDTGVSADSEGGYARELTEEEKQQQQDALAKHISLADAVISTAAIPGRPAPKIITDEMVATMKPGAVIIDLAAESGGNCSLTKAGEMVASGHVRIYGPVNIPSSLSEHASEMYAKNLLNFLTLIIEGEALQLNWEDEIIAGSVLTHAGEIKHEATRNQIEGENA